MSTASVALRVRPETRERLRALADDAELPAVETLDRLVEREHDAMLLRRMIAGMEESHEETAAWDCTAGDGLEETPA